MPHLPRIGPPKPPRATEPTARPAVSGRGAASGLFSGRAVYARANTKGTAFGGHAIYDAPYEDGTKPAAFYENVHRGMKRGDKPQAQDYTQATPRASKQDAHAYAPLDATTRNAESLYETPTGTRSTPDGVYETPVDALSTPDGVYETPIDARGTPDGIYETPVDARRYAPLDTASRAPEPVYETPHVYENSDEVPEPLYEPMAPLARTASEETLYTEIDEPLYEEIPARSETRRDADDPVYETIADARSRDQKAESLAQRALRFILRRPPSV